MISQISASHTLPFHLRLIQVDPVKFNSITLCFCPFLHLPVLSLSSGFPGQLVGDHLPVYSTSSDL